MRMPWTRTPALATTGDPSDEDRLLPLTSGYDQTQHGLYVEHLRRALADPNIYNIALTGNYGTGKSSALDALRGPRHKNVLSLSLSSLGETSDVLPNQDDDRAATTTITNRIQKEIVKQLLYREAPTTVPGSRFRRVSRFPIWRNVAGSAAAVALAFALVYLLDVQPALAGATSEHRPVRILGPLALFALCTLILTWISQLLHRRFWITGLSAAGASVTLSARADSYFDQYLDEIVYFFSCVDADVVIFEDIDRFEDPHIFETLRELNTILRNARQLRGRHIRFVYAIKDSIFERLGTETTEEAGQDAADAELARANRTKFFDLVIPVVPFITHRNARDLMTTVLPNDTFDPRLIDLAARHLTDMRLIKNIHNEYRVFAARLLDAEHGVPALSADALLAMIIYKNIHLSDFELIPRGRSALDELYHRYRQLVADAIDRRLSQRHAHEQALATLDSVAGRSQQLGARLADLAHRIATRQVLATHVVQGYRIGQQPFTTEDVVTPQFWRNLLAGEQHLALVLARPGYSANAVELPLDDLRTELGDDLDLNAWADHDRERMDADVRRVTADINFLGHATIAQLAGRPDVATEIDGARATMGDAIEATLGSGLARDLVRTGFIDQHFSLCVSQYYGLRASATVMTFILRNAETGTMDMHYEFDRPGDLDDLLREAGPSFPGDPSSFNIQLVDHLLDSAFTGPADILEQIARQLIRLTPAAHSFLRTYLATGHNATALIAVLTRLWANIYGYLVDRVDLPETQRVTLIDAALLATDSRLRYAVGEAFADFVQQHTADLACLTKPTSPDIAERIVDLLVQAGVVFADLTLLAPGVCDAVLDAGRYPITTTNLRTALPGSETLALDRIRSGDRRVFERCLRSPGACLAALDGDNRTEHTVEDPNAFVDILAAAADWDDSQLDRLVAGAAPACHVSRLAEVPMPAWAGLARHLRFPASFANVAAYLEREDQGGAADENLATLLRDTDAIVDTEGVPEDRKRALAVLLLNTPAALLAAHRRVALVASLDVPDWLPVAELPAEPGPLLGLLLEHRIVADTADVFAHYANTDWDTLRLGIRHSPDFREHLAPAIVSESVLPDLFSSPEIDGRAKASVLARIDEFAPAGTRTALSSAAGFANVAGIAVGPAALSSFAAAGVDAQLVLRLLLREPADALERTEVAAILRHLPAPHSRLAGGPGKVDVPNDEVNTDLARRLHQLGLATDHRRKRRNDRLRTITVG